MTIIAALKLAWKIYKGGKKADEVADKFRDKKVEKLLKGVGKASTCLVAAFLLSGCATSSVKRLRDAGVEPSTIDRLQLNCVDCYSRAWGWVPFGGGQD
jgi:hypothetical protein